jgi:phage-related protein
MAEELGAGYISLLPSMRNFSKLVKAELKKSLAGVKGEGVDIPVVPKFDQKALDASLAAQKKPLRVPVELEPLRGGPGGRLSPVKVPVELDRDSFRRSLTGLGNDSRSTIHQKVNVDVDRNFVRDQLAGAARDGGKSAASAFTSGFGADLPVLITGIVVAALGSPFIAAATGALILSGAALGALFFGAFLLRGDKDLQKGVQGLFKEVNDTLTKAAQPLKQPFLESLGIIKQAFKDIAPDIETFFKDIAKSGGIQDLARGIGGLIKSFSETGALKKLGEAIGPVLTQIGMALPDIGNALSQFIITITKPEFIQFVGKLLRGLADVIRFVGDAIDWIVQFGTKTGEVLGYVTTGFGVMKDAIMGSPKAIAIVKEAIFSAARLIGEKWRELWSSASAKVTTTVSTIATTVKGIPAKITAALGNTGTLLLNAGRSVVQGLINGIKAKFGALGNIMSNVGGIIYNHLQHSPAKYGPLAGKGNTFYSGQAIADGLTSGVQSRLPNVTSAASQLAGSFGFGSTSRAAAPDGPVLQVVSDGTRAGDLLVDLLSDVLVSKYGGNVQVLAQRR